MTAPLRSHLLAGAVGHRRLRVRDYAFTHRVWYLAVDLDEVDDVAARSRLLAYEGRGVLQLLRRDHPAVEGEGAPAEALRRRLCSSGFDARDWRITLIAYPRALGYVFNPVSFYLCHDVAGALRHVIAEVHNTHGECEVYDFPPDSPLDAPPDTSPGAAAGGSAPPVFTSSTAKRLYVSPFIGPGAHYRLRVVERGEQLAIGIHETEGGEGALDASVRLWRRPLSDTHLARLLALDPVVPLKTVVLIGWHALRMWLRGVPWDRFRPREHYPRP